MRYLLSLSFFTVAVTAFQPRPSGHNRRLVILKAEDKSLTFNPMEGYQSIDLKRAKECAEHFGKCSVEEMEQLKDSE